MLLALSATITTTIRASVAITSMITTIAVTTSLARLSTKFLPLALALVLACTQKYLVSKG